MKVIATNKELISYQKENLSNLKYLELEAGDKSEWSYEVQRTRETVEALERAELAIEECRKIVNAYNTGADEGEHVRDYRIGFARSALKIRSILDGNPDERFQNN